MPSVLVESVYSSEEALFLLMLYHVEVIKTVWSADVAVSPLHLIYVRR